MSDDDHGRRFRDAAALVVGASTGIGLATARRLAEEGASVTVADLVLEEARDAAASLPTGQHRAVALDVLDPAAAAAAVRGLDRLDVLVVVSGGAVPHGTFAETGDDAWHAALELNLLGPARVIRAALPLLERSEAAAVCVISSANASLALGSEPYSAAKAGLESLVANLAASSAARGIRVNAVAPGTVRTRVWDAQGGPDRLADRYPLGRVGEPEDIAAAIAFLCSRDAVWITGAVLPVDGGLRLRNPLHG